MVKGPLEQIPNEVLTVENLSILPVSGISPGHLIDWEELTAKLYRNKIPAAPGLVEYAKFRAGIGHTRCWLNDPTAIRIPPMTGQRRGGPEGVDS